MSFKHKGIVKEYKALAYLVKLGYRVYRVPMSLLPFDILAINPDKNEILFVEVKSEKSRLSKRQEEFKKMIDAMPNWYVRYRVLKITDSGDIEWE